ncbi:protein of unknown function [Candidatus Filomicrobium marinum]|uniref:Uncharacterized protein n=2 Tax=Filomicrobium TaxID=119044 RepID=A0A0D6JH94_9HYPH|nr:protein of unknown function [Candidatus Filomicrobium marinum]CPR20893.1 protein of unknown function [Candidatus Filomicrobium marinum]SDP20749.1 hypothetical protein SAMN04488061_2499 [Filomicrobium insigne]
MGYRWADGKTSSHVVMEPESSAARNLPVSSPDANAGRAGYHPPVVEYGELSLPNKDTLRLNRLVLIGL